MTDAERLARRLSYFAAHEEASSPDIRHLLGEAAAALAARDAEIAELRAEREAALAALEFYADPETYHGVAFLFDRPCGGFDEDFSEHGHEDYDRPMPGKFARAALDGARETT